MGFLYMMGCPPSTSTLTPEGVLIALKMAELKLNLSFTHFYHKEKRYLRSDGINHTRGVNLPFPESLVETTQFSIKNAPLDMGPPKRNYFQ